MWADVLRVAGFFGAIRGLALWTRSRAKYKRAVRVLKIAVTARRVHTSRKRVIEVRLPALVLTFDSREKVLDRIVARSVPGRFGLAQVESSDPPAQLSTDCWGSRPH
jgi:hypothetical protein